jgi:hypothetical protein
VTHVTPDRIDPAEGEKLASQLSPQSLSCIDFDALRAWLQAASTKLVQVSQLDQQHAEQLQLIRDEQNRLGDSYQLLRDDYQARIVGMLKAIAVAGSTRSSSRTETSRDHDSLSVLLDSLATMPADDLIRCYRKTSACFRDHFPGSFALPKTSNQ